MNNEYTIVRDDLIAGVIITMKLSLDGPAEVSFEAEKKYFERRKEGVTSFDGPFVDYAVMKYNFDECLIKIIVGRPFDFALSELKKDYDAFWSSNAGMLKYH